MAKIYTDGSWQNIQPRKYGTDTDNVTSFPETILTSGDNVNSYSVYGNMVQDSYNEHTFSGTSPLSYDSNGSNLVRYGIDGNLVQSGTPTPSAPITPSETGDKTANLFNQNDYALVQVTASAYRYGTIIGVLPQGEYVFNAITASGAQTLYLTKELNGEYTFEGIKSMPFSFTADGASKYIIQTANNTGTTWADFGYTNMIVNSGSTALPYEPYGYKLSLTNNSTTYPIYIQEPIRKIGDYADSVNSDGTVTRNIKKLVLTGNEIITKAASNPVFTMSLSNAFSGTGISTVSTHYAAQTNVSGTGNVTNLCVSVRRGYNTLYIGDDSFVDAPAFKTFLSTQYAAGTPVTVWYVLETPTTETITTPQIPTVKGSNTLSVTTTLAPSNIEVVSNIDLSPDNIILPEECGDRTANLFNMSLLQDNKGLNANGVVIDQTGRTTTVTPIDVELLSSVVLSYTTSGSSISFIYALFNGSTLVERTASNYSGDSIDVSSGDSLYICFYASATVSKSDLSNIMLNTGSIALPYEPYGYKIPITINNTTNNIYVSNPIRKIGDYIDIIGNSGTVTRRIKKLVLTGNENWAVYSGFSAQNCYQFNTNITNHYVNSVAIITHFTYTSVLRTLIDNDGTFMFDSNKYIRVHISRCATLEDFIAYLAAQYAAGTPVTVWYVLATPDTSEQTTIPVIQTIEGNNTIDIDTALKPSNLEISYKGWHKIDEKIYNNGSWT